MSWCEQEGVAIMLRHKSEFIGRRLVIASLLFSVLAGTVGSFALHGAPQDTASITVSAAISLQDALDELGPIFQVQQHRKNGGNGTAVTYNYGGSGTLARQTQPQAPGGGFFFAAGKTNEETG